MRAAEAVEVATGAVLDRWATEPGAAAPLADLVARLTGVRGPADLTARRDRCLAGLPAVRQACVDLGDLVDRVSR